MVGLPSKEHHDGLDKGSSSLSHQAVSGLGLERGDPEVPLSGRVGV